MVRAVANARAICNQHYPNAHQIEVADLIEDPQRALADAVIVTPTLLRVMPLPVQRRRDGT
ncbi:MAG: hypothetical protein H0V80_00780 [Acidobacteria bacterium]|nr:hypothetical protein [Acidobacteriota bacterium]